MKPEIITMCGSTRFADLMAAISWELEKRGKIVLRVNYLPEWYVKNSGLATSTHIAEQQGLKEQLDELHCRKIDMSDMVFVCNLGNYIGESTRKEIMYAKKVKKPVFYLEQYTKMEEIHEKAMELKEWWETIYMINPESEK